MVTKHWLLVFGLFTFACGSDTAPATGKPTNEGGPNGGAGGSGGLDSGAGGAKEAGPDGATGAGGAVPLEPTDGGSYSDESLWLCLPGKADDVCHQNLDATIVNADGTTKAEPHVFATNPPVDCFYVYPTISSDKTGNSDFIPAETEEINVTRQQAARLSSVCNVYAPIYRQVTLGILFGGGQSSPPNPAIAYGDVTNAWTYFQSHYSKGRPFILIGHSQGASVLNRLIKDRIDGDAAMRARLVSAFLIGGNVVVPDGKDVGGDFQNIPLCRDKTQQSCVVAYSTFRSTAPPPDTALFGKPRGGAAGVVACNNPAALAGGPVNQKPYFSSDGNTIKLGSIQVTTPYVTLPDFLRGECVSKNGFNYLELTILADPADPRPDDIGGDLTPDWGLHLVDVNIAMGDIVNLAASEVAARPDQ